LNNNNNNNVQYEKMVLSQLLPATSVLPFAFEATGRLGTLAFAFLHEVLGTQTYRKSWLLRKISFICAWYMGKMLKATKDWFLLTQNG
jgi:hypothetical protein